VAAINVNLGKDVTYVNDNGGQFDAGVTYTSGQIAISVVATGGAFLIANIFANF
jgi:hypothetical protein